MILFSVSYKFSYPKSINFDLKGNIISPLLKYYYISKSDNSKCYYLSKKHSFKSNGRETIYKKINTSNDIIIKIKNNEIEIINDLSLITFIFAIIIPLLFCFLFFNFFLLSIVFFYELLVLYLIHSMGKNSLNKLKKNLFKGK